MPDDAKLLDRAAALVDAARRAGASAADAAVTRSRSRSVDVRNGKVEGTDASETDRVSLRVFVGERVASVAGDADAPAAMLAERAVAMAKVSPADPYAGLAPEERLARELVDLDLHDATEVPTDALVSAAMEAEAAALDVPNVAQSGGAGAYVAASGLVLATSHGFSGSYAGTTFGHSVSAIAGEGTGMERDYDFSARRHHADLEPPAEVGRRAGERAARRLGGRQIETQRASVVLDPRIARGLLGTLASAVNGGAVARGTTFLRERMGERILPAGVSVVDDPTLPRRMGSRPFDAEGVRGERLALVEDGVLRAWLLSSPIGRQLGLETNGRAVRSGSSVGAGSTNLALSPGSVSPEELLRDVGTGLYVTEMIGRGADLVSGDYSRGASGFWIENGALGDPVTEVTVGTTLQHIFAEMVLADDLDTRFSTVAPTLAIPDVTLAGR